MKTYDLIFALGRKVLESEDLSFEEALSLTRIQEADIPLLLGVANKVRERFTGGKVDTCEIVNARSGNCSEDCKFCAQSAHYKAVAAVYPLMSGEKILAAAKEAEKNGAYRFGIVTAGCSMEKDPDFRRITAAIRQIRRETQLNCCCSLGIIQDEHAALLRDAGITRYHHNLETSESFFPNICSTHTYRQRVETIKRAKAAGLEVCSGGIIGMGEDWSQRVELAFALKALDVDSVPVNVLNPLEGTPLAGTGGLKPQEILQTFALFRLILPTKTIRYAGGREYGLGELVPLGFLSGINGMLIGNYLTTEGRGAERDIKTVTGLGLEPLCVKNSGRGVTGK